MIPWVISLRDAANSQQTSIITICYYNKKQRNKDGSLHLQIFLHLIPSSVSILNYEDWMSARIFASVGNQSHSYCDYICLLSSHYDISLQ